MKNQVVIFLPSLQQGGVVRTLIEALEVVDPEKHEITVYVYQTSNSWQKYLPEWVKVIADTDRSHYHRRPKGLYFHLLILLAKLAGRKEKTALLEEKLHAFVHGEKTKYPSRRYFKDGIDISISYNVGLCTEMAAYVKAGKKYLFFHSCDPDFHKDITGKCFGSFDNIIAIGENVRRILTDSYPEFKEKIAVIRNYLNSEKIVRLANEYTVEKTSPGDVSTITSVIRVDKEKGADLLIEAAKILKADGLSFVWYIVGDGERREEAEEHIGKYDLKNNVVITGFRDNPYPYFKCCDVYVHPAYEESFGLSILEALILKKAVVSTDTVGAREVLRDGRFGMLVSFDAASLADGVTEVLSSPQKRAEFENSYSGQNDKERAEYKEKWATILSGGTL